MYFCDLNDNKDISKHKEKFKDSRNRDLLELRNKKLLIPNTLILFNSSAKYYYQQHKYPEGFEKEFDSYIKTFEKKCNKRLDDPDKPLILNVCTDVGGKVTGIGFSNHTLHKLVDNHGRKKAYIHYVQLLHDFSNIILKAPFIDFYSFINSEQRYSDNEFLTDISEKDFLEYVKQYKEKISSIINKEFPDDPFEILNLTIDSLMINVCENIQEDIYIQEMILPVYSEKSFEGIFYTRNPYTGNRDVYGVYNKLDNIKYPVTNTQEPHDEALEKKFPQIFDKLKSYGIILEKYFKDIIEVTFVTTADGGLYLLQTNKASKTARASLKSRIELYEDKIINATEVIEGISPDEIETLCHVTLDRESKRKMYRFKQTGIPGAPGAATGKLFLNVNDVREYYNSKKEVNKNIILAIDDLTIDDHWVIHLISGLITRTSGMSSHGAIMARSRGIPCIVGLNMQINLNDKQLIVEDKSLDQGDDITIEVTDKGYLYQGIGKLVSMSYKDDMLKEFCNLLLDFQKKERIDINVMININNAEDAEKGLNFGADGVGLCRTENFFISEDRLLLLRQFLFTHDKEKRQIINEKIYSLQVSDYYNILKIIKDKPFVIRLMDVPLNEIMPNSKEEIHELKQALPFISDDEIHKTAFASHENNPMFGLRGCRYGLINEELYIIQISAILSAVYQFKNNDKNPNVFILIPLVMNAKEFLILKNIIIDTKEKINNNFKLSQDGISVKVGAMIELPSAALSADKIAAYADFFSFGTNDLTQAVYGISRNDAGRYMPFYLKNNIINYDPFSRLDDEVCELIRIAVKKGRQIQPDIMFSICGEQGGEANSLLFALKTKINSVSVSPYRILPTRLRLIHQYLKDKQKQMIP
jgi:pyruvate,orthophosphate dikinase